MFLLVPAHPGSPGQRALKRLLLLLLLLLLLFEVLHDVSKQVSCYLKQTATRDILKELFNFKNSYTNNQTRSVCLCHGEHGSYFLAPCEPPARRARIRLETPCVANAQ